MKAIKTIRYLLSDSLIRVSEVSNIREKLLNNDYIISVSLEYTDSLNNFIKRSSKEHKNRYSSTNSFNSIDSAIQFVLNYESDVIEMNSFSDIQSHIFIKNFSRFEGLGFVVVEKENED